MKKITTIVLLLVVFMLLSACGKEKYEPQAINPEVDICDVCKMAIKDDQYATQIMTKDSQSIKFDDIGDMHKWKQENGMDNIGAEFVRDYHTLQWLPYDKAYYVYDANIQTPMAYGIVSFENEEDANNFIGQHGSGKLMTAEQLKDHTWEVNHEMKEKIKQEHMRNAHNKGDNEQNKSEETNHK